ncbi:hypothetical protein WOLCODRAFT_127226 [Wolfiporia cocos MD-104 SS10]|uniref:Uncharacterized protein n=1 Tax=Wolfiporia cocos (strain MD-104) TaxID=742152 RepID=A0A2H3JKC9_WOLCO|nr:hypothetical protein WOLCODRAFT_127226 [Wolfiporia cocos MD-104 SS10]
MDASSSAHPGLGRTSSNGKMTCTSEKPEEKPIISKPAAPPTNRGKSYKEKFQALREKFEQVSATHEQYEKELAVANQKLKSLQAEINLLLDAVDIAAYEQEVLVHYMTQDPVPPEYDYARSHLRPRRLADPVQGQTVRTNGRGHS